MKIGQKVKFIGNIDQLLTGVHESELIESYIISKNIFYISEFKFEKVEICWCVDEGESHYFYVEETEVETIAI